MHQVSVARPGLSQHQDVVSGNFSISALFVFCAVVCKDKRGDSHPLWVCLSEVTMVRRLSPQSKARRTRNTLCNLLSASRPRATTTSKPRGLVRVFLLTWKQEANSSPETRHSYQPAAHSLLNIRRPGRLNWGQVEVWVSQEAEQRLRQSPKATSDGIWRGQESREGAP